MGSMQDLRGEMLPSFAALMDLPLTTPMVQSPAESDDEDEDRERNSNPSKSRTAPSTGSPKVAAVERRAMFTTTTSLCRFEDNMTEMLGGTAALSLDGADEAYEPEDGNGGVVTAALLAAKSTEMLLASSTEAEPSTPLACSTEVEVLDGFGVLLENVGNSPATAETLAGAMMF